MKWQSAPELKRSVKSLPLPLDLRQTGILFNRRVLDKSGAAWEGDGVSPVDAPLSDSMTRVAVNSWDGAAIAHSFLDPS